MTKYSQAYLDFLETPQWWSTRKQVLQRAGYRCERCPNPAAQVHHKAGYRDLGCERLEDLEALCDPCHRREHEAKNRTLRIREQMGQMRLFDRWIAPEPHALRKPAA